MNISPLEIQEMTQLLNRANMLNIALRMSRTGGWELDLATLAACRTQEHDRIFGYDSLLPQWTYGMLLEHVLLEDRAAVDGSFRAAIAEQTAWSIECRIRRLDGETRWIQVIGEHQCDEPGRARRMVGIVKDITERKRADAQTVAAMRALNELKAALDEHAIVAITDPKGKITYVNDKFCVISKYSREELIGQDHRIINSGFHSREFIRSIWQAIGCGRVWKGEIKNRAKDGTYYWMDTTIVPFLGDDGIPAQYVAIRADITERKRCEGELQEKNIELEEASRMKSEFLANMSHELRTPLNAIIGFSDILKDGLAGEMTDEQRSFTCEIFSSGKHLLSLINDILDLSKVEAGAMTLDLESMLVSSLLVNSLSIIRERATARNIRLILDVPEGLDSIQADVRKIKQILYNLLSNAVKFASEGGLVTLHACRVPRAEVGRPWRAWPERCFPLAENEFTDFLRISVTDSGMGIPPEGLKHLFTHFRQIDSGLSRKFEGTGLGLTMVKLLAELHGGTVALESAVGKGSCCTVWLPLRTTEVESITSDTSAVTAHLAPAVT